MPDLVDNLPPADALFAVNWTVFATIAGLSVYGVVNQTAFAVFLVATASMLWRWMPVGRSTPTNLSE
jgi:hypothetical protein